MNSCLIHLFLLKEVGTGILQEIYQSAQYRLRMLDEYLAGNWGRFTGVELQLSQEQQDPVPAVWEACCHLL